MGRREHQRWRDLDDSPERDLLLYELGPREGRGPKRKGPIGRRRSDERILEDVGRALRAHPEIDASEIAVAVRDGEITLRGAVSERSARRLAQEALERLPGVRDVRNEIRLDAQAAR